MAELYADAKNCPFCDGEASLRVDVIQGEYIAQYHCKECASTGRASYIYSKREDAVREAKANWNRRV